MTCAGEYALLLDAIQRSGRDPVVRTPDSLAGSDVAPGTVVRLPAGEYHLDDGWTVELQGEPERPIIIEPEPGEEVTLRMQRPWRSSAREAGLLVRNSRHVTIRSGLLGGLLRITNDADERHSYGGAEENRPPCIDVLSSPGVRVENVLLDNGGFGVLRNSPSTGGTSRGVIASRIGWEGHGLPAPRGRGHSFYEQAGDTLLDGCFAGYNYGSGYQLYGSASIEHVVMRRCVSVNAWGSTHLGTMKQQCSIGSEQGKSGHISVIDCVLWASQGTLGGGDPALQTTLALGYRSTGNGRITVRGCLLNGQTTWLEEWDDVTFVDNVQRGRVQILGGPPVPLTWGMWRQGAGERWNAPDWRGRDYYQEFASAFPDNEYGVDAYQKDGDQRITAHRDDVSGWGIVTVAGTTSGASWDPGTMLAVGNTYEVRPCSAAETVLDTRVYDGQPIALPSNVAATAPIGGSIREGADAAGVCEAFLIRRIR